MTLEKLYIKLPSDESSGTRMLNQTNGLRSILVTCELLEQKVGGNKLIEAQINAYKFQLLAYLIEGKLPYAKFLWKRLPRSLRIPGPLPQRDNNGNELKPKDNPNLKDAKEFNAIWAIGKCMWREEFSKVYPLIQNGNWNKILLPFMRMLENNHRNRMIELVSKAYTSITIKELNENYLGLKNFNDDIKNILNDNKNWSFDTEDKNVIIIDHATDNVILDPSLLSKFSQYVVFMEGIQDLDFDRNAKAMSDNKNSNQKN